MKPIIIPSSSDPSQYAPCRADFTIRYTPIEDHPLFSKPDVRFRHARTRKAFRRLKALGIETFTEQFWKIYPEPPQTTP